MKKLAGYLPLLLLFVSLASCKSIKDLEVKGIQSASIVAANDTTADVAITLRIGNPNKFNIIVRKYNLEAFLNTKPVAKTKFDKKIRIPKRSEGDYTLVVSTDMRQVRRLIPGVMFSNKAKLNVKGDILVRAMCFTKRIKVDREETVTRKELEKIILVNK